MRFATIFSVVLAMLAGVISVRAHQPGESYLNLTIENDRLVGQLDIALRDIDAALVLDANGDGQVTYEELQAKQSAIAAYAFERLQLSVNGRQLTPEVTQHQVAQHPDGIYAVVNFEASGFLVPTTLDITYRLLFELNTLHRGLVNLSRDGRSQVAIFTPEKPVQHFELTVPSPERQFFQFAGEGVWHIWMGFDHILFLLALLLPSVLRREGNHWQVVTGFRPAVLTVIKVITAFTVAHSITLTLATLHLVQLPPRFVESAIAASVILAALNNVWPFFHGRAWVVAFAFGLVHGFGFANSLDQLGLQQGILALTLVGFNVGVEVGQLAIVSVFLPAAYWMRASWFYQNLTVKMGSIGVALIASTWFVQRVFDLPLLPF